MRRLSRQLFTEVGLAERAVGALVIASVPRLHVLACTLYTSVATRPIPGTHPFGARLALFKVVPDDVVSPLCALRLRRS